ncbi:MAG: sigma-54 dependent transcriptional regulator [Myxococcota bacterium]
MHDHADGPEHVDVELRPILDAAGEIRFFLEVVTPLTLASARAAGAFVGRGPAFLEVLGLLRRAAPSEVPVLILGESGTGKELAARALHAASERREGPFVPVECSGLGEGLFESELFGHAKGAFTGAHARKTGLVEAAAGGTLFLDEIGDVPLALQVKLLRLLESGTYRPVGDVQPRRADFRLVCATHRDLDARVADGRFRRDLYFRINAFPVPMPPLRERREDLPLLTEALLRGTGKRLGPEGLETLRGHDWPGNVRELRNVLERAVLLSDRELLEPRHLLGRRLEPSEPAPAAGPWPWGDAVLPLAEVEARYVRWAAARLPGDRRQLADALGLTERTLYRRLRDARTHDDDA